MPRQAVTVLGQRLARTASSRPMTRSSTISTQLTRQTPSPIRQASRITFITTRRSFGTTRTCYKGLTPETDNPQPKVAEPNTTASSVSPIELSEAEYHELSDSYLNTLVEQLEELQEAREDVDVEYSVSLPLDYNGLSHDDYAGWCPQPSSTTKWELRS